MSDRFLFTSGRRSPHHEHTGYGLVEGLEGEALEAVDRLEELCLALLRPRRPRRGALVALAGGREVWRGALDVEEGREPSGRPNLAARGALPPVSCLCDEGVSWRFEEEGGGSELLAQGASRFGFGARGRLRVGVALLVALSAALLVAGAAWWLLSAPGRGWSWSDG